MMHLTHLAIRLLMEMIELPIPTLILQHPQEPSRKDNAVSSVHALQQRIKPCHVAIGLSWKNLGQALKNFKDLPDSEDYLKPGNWVTLYLGTKNQSQSGGQSSSPLKQPQNVPGIYFLDKKGNPTEPAEHPICGLILLDGTWSQAKTLWWRNAWLLKTQRMYLVPKEKSRYGNIRKEPRPECVSTLEAAAECYSFFGFDPNVEIQLKSDFKNLLKTYG
jgi:hypothetical protein